MKSFIIVLKEALTQVPYQQLSKDFTNSDSLNTLHFANIARTYSYDLHIWYSCKNVHSMLQSDTYRERRLQAFCSLFTGLHCGDRYH